MQALILRLRGQFMNLVKVITIVIQKFINVIKVVLHKIIKLILKIILLLMFINSINCIIEFFENLFNSLFQKYVP